MKTIEYAELTEEQQSQVDELTNDTLPQGQDLFLEGFEVVAIESNLRSLYEAQNRKGIESGSVIEII
jgi:hypothetical protein